MTGLVLVAGGVIALAVAAIAWVRPSVALLLLIAFDISNLNGVIADQIGVSPYKPQLALALLIAVVVLVRDRFRVPWSPVLLGVGALFAGFCLSLLAAADPATSQSLLLERTRDLLYFVVVYILMTATDSVDSVARVVVLVMAALAGLTLVHQFVLHNSGDLWGLSRVPIVQEGGAYTARHAGTSSDVNFWARLLVLVTPLTFSLFAATTRRRQQVLWIGCALSLLGGIYLTQSRGGFIAMLVGLVCWLAVAGGRYRKLLLVLPVLLAILLPLSGVASRLGSVDSADASVTERKRLQLDAWRMFVDSPLLGHGIGSYGSIFHNYDRLADAYQPVTIVVAAHNLYLEQAADGGIVLLLAWGLFVSSIGFVAFRARALSAGEPTTRFLAIGVIAGLLGWLVASAFLHLSDFRALLVIAAMAGALDVRARARSAVPLPARPKRRSRPAPLPALVALACLGIAGMVAVVALGQATYQSSATLAVVPASSKADGSAAYQLDVVSRGVIVPTLATVLDHSISPSDLEQQAERPAPSGLRLQIEPSTSGGAVVITVTAPDPDDVQAFTAAAVELARERTAALGSGYQLRGEPTGVQSIQPPVRWIAVPAAGCLALAALGVVQRLRRRRRTPPPRLAEPINAA